MNRIVISVIILVEALSFIEGNSGPSVASLVPPYTCTTTICQPGRVATRSSVDGSVGDLEGQGRPGKEGPPGMKGAKGDKGDPCQCDVADEEEVAEMRRSLEAMKIENAELKKILPGIKRLASPPQSCLQLREDGETESGIYNIRTSNKSQTFEVFCDMESDGGGWTMVASIHENNLAGKCTLGDLWSCEQKDIEEIKSSGNWINYNTFGSVGAATSADYKNEAYYNLQASDLMIWHVPNDVEINEASRQASLKYYTTTSFLRDYGGNLRTLFDEHYPLENAPPRASLFGYVRNLIVSLNSSASSIRGTISSFFNYAYDGGDLKISDGGNDMFDNGNKLSYRIGSHPWTRIRYNINYRNATPEVDLLSATSHPFNLLMWVGNGNRAVSSFSLKADEGDAGADGGGIGATKTGTISSGQYILKYYAYSIYDADDSSICKVFYYITNTEAWASVAPSSVNRDPWSSGTSALNHGIVLSGSPKSILVGYTLLSRNSALEVTSSNIQDALRKILERIVASPTVVSCDRTSASLIQPVQYERGNDYGVWTNVPSSEQSKSTAGFIQLRAFDRAGVPYALCPGVQTTSCNCRSFCLGGVADSDSCGDFGGANLARSSILIFTRNSE